MAVLRENDRSSSARILRFTVYFLLTTWALLFLIPFFYMVVTSIKGVDDLRHIPPTIWPERYHFENFILAYFGFGEEGFSRYFLNSLISTGMVIIYTLLICATAAYSVAFLLKARTANWMTMFFLATMMVPESSNLISLYQMMSRFPFGNTPGLTNLPSFNMLNSYWALVLPFLANGFAVYLFITFFRQLPRELFEAARIDGANELRILVQIVTPLSKPVFSVLVIFTYIWHWNQFLWPYIVSGSPKMWTITVALYKLQSSAGSGVDFSTVMAGACMVALPSIIFFFLFQKNIEKGVVLSGIKG